MTTVKQIQSILKKSVKRSAASTAKFYKTGTGQYAEHDRFMGIPTPILRKLSQEFKTLSITGIKQLLHSIFNEERLLALFILVHQYKAGSTPEKNRIYQFYLDNIKQVNNWNLVDSSAHLIVGMHLLNGNKKKLISLARSKDLWARRIAIVATWIFIRHAEYTWTIKIAKMLLNDSHDLIHKAVGWMLREMGKRDVNTLKTFLDDHARFMPRTMLRYAIEKLPTRKQKSYLSKKIMSNI